MEGKALFKKRKIYIKKYTDKYCSSGTLQIEWEHALAVTYYFRLSRVIESSLESISFIYEIPFLLSKHGRKSQLIVSAYAEADPDYWGF